MGGDLPAVRKGFIRQWMQRQQGESIAPVYGSGAMDAGNRQRDEHLRFPFQVHAGVSQDQGRQRRRRWRCVAEGGEPDQQVRLPLLQQAPGRPGPGLIDRNAGAPC